MTPRELRQALNISGPLFWLQAVAGALLIDAFVSLPVILRAITQ